MPARPACFEVVEAPARRAERPTEERKSEDDIVVELLLTKEMFQLVLEVGETLIITAITSCSRDSIMFSHVPSPVFVIRMLELLTIAPFSKSVPHSFIHNLLFPHISFSWTSC